MPFIIEKADRAKSKVCVALAGDSGSGKTLSSIRLARGLVGEKGRIGYIDTEQHRASLYAGYYGGFDVINLEPPFSPERYEEAVRTFKDAGYDVVVIDSMSHEWEGTGGVLEMADSQTYGNGKPMVGLDKWCKPKIAHRKMMNYIMNCGMNVIFCYRVKYNMVEGVDERGKKTLTKDQNPTIVREPNVNYDITVDLTLDANKIPHISGKCPEALEWLFGHDMITEETGANIIEWLHSVQRDADAIVSDGAKQKDLRAWFGTLNPFEQYLARKYSDKIKQVNTAKEKAPAPAKELEKEEPEKETQTYEEVEL